MAWAPEVDALQQLVLVSPVVEVESLPAASHAVAARVAFWVVASHRQNCSLSVSKRWTRCVVCVAGLARENLPAF